MRSMVRIVLALACAGLLAGCANVVWSPDGKTLAFPWISGKDGYVATMNLDGSGFRYLPGSADMSPLAWSPDGKKLLIGKDQGDLTLVNIEASRSRKVLDRFVQPVVWTDSNRIISGRRSEDGSSQSLVWLDLGTNKIDYEKKLGVSLGEPPEGVWLKATDGIAFIGMDGNVYAVIRGELLKITSTDDVIGLASNSAGTSLTWARRSRNPRYILLSLYHYDLNLRAVRKLPFPDRIPAINPNPRTGPDDVPLVRFSPNLTEMVVVSQYGKFMGDAKVTAHRMSLDGSNARPVYSLKDGATVAPVALNWSPDGSQIAALDGNDDLLRLVLHGGAQPPKVLRSAKNPKK